MLTHNAKSIFECAADTEAPALLGSAPTVDTSNPKGGVMVTGLLCGLMMVAMIWMMVAMPVANHLRRTTSDHADDTPSET